MTEHEAPAPAGWPARAQQSFLAALWDLVVDEDDYTDGRPSWIGPRSGQGPDGEPTGALQRILACGVDPDDLTDLVRQRQHEILHNVCQLIDDPGLLGIGLDEEWSEPTDVRWELTAVRTTGPADRAPMVALHASLDQLDPSGRHGEPRGRPVPARLPGYPLHARVAVAQARAGDRVQAVTTWRRATGLPVLEAKAALDGLLADLADDGPSASTAPR